MAQNKLGSDVHSGITILVEGVRELNAKLAAAGKDAADMRDLMHRLGTIVITGARPPVDAGELAGTMRAGRGKTKAVVRAGYAKRGAHAGVVHYGNPKRRSRAQPFLTESLRQNQAKVATELANGIDRIFITNNLR